MKYSNVPKKIMFSNEILWNTGFSSTISQCALAIPSYILYTIIVYRIFRWPNVN